MKKRRHERLSLDLKNADNRLEVSTTLRVSTIAIKFNCVAGALARGTAIFSARLRRTTTNRILTSYFLVVCHETLLSDRIVLRVAYLSGTSIKVDSGAQWSARLCTRKSKIHVVRKSINADSVTH